MLTLVVTQFENNERTGDGVKAEYIQARRVQ